MPMLSLTTEDDALFIARDIAGEKSLYVYEDKQFLIISSQINAIGAFGVRLDVNLCAFRDYFHSRHFLQHEATAFQNVRQMVPGSIEKIDVDTGKTLTKRVRSVNDLVSASLYEEYQGRTNDELAEILDGLLSDCVRQMVPADRRYASVISGGVDSSWSPPTSANTAIPTCWWQSTMSARTISVTS